MGNLSLDSNEATPLPSLANHYLCLTPADPKSPVLTVAYVGEPASGSSPGGPVGAAEYGADPKSPVSESLIARLTISEQHYSLGVGKTRNSVLQDLFDQLFIPHPNGERHHQPGCRVDHLCLPQLLTLTASEAPALIGLQAGAGQLLDPLIVEALGLLPKADC